MKGTALRLLVAMAAVLGGTMAARADACDGLAAGIASELGARVGRRQGPSIDLRIPDGTKIDLTCRAEPIVQAASGDPSPSAAYFRDLSVAGAAAVGEPAGTVQGALARAYETSLRERRKSFIQQNGWSASCYTDPSGTIRTLCSVGRIPPG